MSSHLQFGPQSIRDSQLIRPIKSPTISPKSNPLRYPLLAPYPSGQASKDQPPDGLWTSLLPPKTSPSRVATEAAGCSNLYSSKPIMGGEQTRASAGRQMSWQVNLETSHLIGGCTRRCHRRQRVTINQSFAGGRPLSPKGSKQNRLT